MGHVGPPAPNKNRPVDGTMGRGEAVGETVPPGVAGEVEQIEV